MQAVSPFAVPPYHDERESRPVPRHRHGAQAFRLSAMVDAAVCCNASTAMNTPCPCTLIVSLHSGDVDAPHARRPGTGRTHRSRSKAAACSRCTTTGPEDCCRVIRAAISFRSTAHGGDGTAPCRTSLPEVGSPMLAMHGASVVQSKSSNIAACPMSAEIDSLEFDRSCGAGLSGDCEQPSRPCTVPKKDLQYSCQHRACAHDQGLPTRSRRALAARCFCLNRARRLADWLKRCKHRNRQGGSPSH